jgi:hypothetical protein
MSDQFPPPGWLPGPETWPYWLPTTQLSNAWDQAAPAWPRSTIPPISNGGILGSVPHMNDADAEISPSRSGGILGSFGQPNDSSDQSTRGGILAPLERLNPGRPQAFPAWLQSAMPLAANAGSAAAWPTLPYLYPLLSQSAMRYTAALQPNDIDAVAAPLEHVLSIVGALVFATLSAVTRLWLELDELLERVFAVAFAWLRGVRDARAGRGEYV